MEIIPVTALRIRSISFENQKLAITFKNGHIHQYRRVPETAFRRFATAPHVDKYYDAHIKNKYLFSKRVNS